MTDAAGSPQNGEITPSRWHPIDSKYFKGRALLRVRGFDDITAPYFEGKTRLQSVVIQGQFKSAVKANLVQTGQEFREPVRFPPMTRVLISMLRRVVTDLRMETSAEGGFLTLSSVLRTAQRVNTERRFVEWNLTDEIPEDTALLGTTFASIAGDFKARRKHCSDEAFLKQINFPTDIFFTFEFFNSFVDLTNFQLLVSRWKLSLRHHLNDQPIKLLARVMRNEIERWDEFHDEDILWSFEIKPGTLLKSS